MKRILIILTLVMTVGLTVEAQCPMCKASVESGMKDENSKGRGLNDGILYLLATPYLAIAVIGGAWYYKRKQ
ncbi:MAG: hypothetical protein QMC70_10115 [Bacteroidia bacterium]|jgi:hypothetical protein|tara:strand:- start:335 stop:550 length:216 start_codon:yes stop_codon:yes gene_type:complete